MRLRRWWTWDVVIGNIFFFDKVERFSSCSPGARELLAPRIGRYLLGCRGGWRASKSHEAQSYCALPYYFCLAPCLLSAILCVLPALMRLIPQQCSHFSQVAQLRPFPRLGGDDLHGGAHLRRLLLELLELLVADALRHQQRVDHALPHALNDLVLAIGDEPVVLRQRIKEPAHELLLPDHFLAGKDVLALLQQLLEAELVRVAQVLHRDDLLLELIGNLALLDEIVFCRPGAADDDALQSFKMEELLLHVFRDLPVVVPGGALALPGEPRSRLSSCLELAWHLGVCLQEGNDGFPFQQGNDGIPPVNDHQIGRA